jgi:hypothetical protein
MIRTLLIDCRLDLELEFGSIQDETS